MELFKIYLNNPIPNFNFMSNTYIPTLGNFINPIYSELYNFPTLDKDVASRKIITFLEENPGENRDILIREIMKSIQQKKDDDQAFFLHEKEGNTRTYWGIWVNNLIHQNKEKVLKNLNNFGEQKNPEDGKKFSECLDTLYGIFNTFYINAHFDFFSTSLREYYNNIHSIKELYYLKIFMRHV